MRNLNLLIIGCFLALAVKIQLSLSELLRVPQDDEIKSHWGAYKARQGLIILRLFNLTLFC
jgi:hypothetical protein